MSDRKGAELKRKYQDQWERGFGGLFDIKTRLRLLGEARPYGGREPGKTIANFWRRARNYVKNALIDIELFLEVADRKNVNIIFTKEALEPVVKALLHRPVMEYHYLIVERRPQDPDHPENLEGFQGHEPDRERAEIARMFIQYGFNYLTMKRRSEPLSQEIVQKAISLSNLLVESFRTGGEE